jgi:hypothetical protein
LSKICAASLAIRRKPNHTAGLESRFGGSNPYTEYAATRKSWEVKELPVRGGYRLKLPAINSISLEPDCRTKQRIPFKPLNFAFIQTSKPALPWQLLFSAGPFGLPFGDSPRIANP